MNRLSDPVAERGVLPVVPGDLLADMTLGSLTRAQRILLTQWMAQHLGLKNPRIRRAPPSRLRSLFAWFGKARSLFVEWDEDGQRTVHEFELKDDRTVLDVLGVITSCKEVSACREPEDVNAGMSLESPAPLGADELVEPAARAFREQTLTEAEGWFREAVAKTRYASPEWLETMQDLANFYAAVSRYAHAQAVYGKMMRALESAEEPDPRVLGNTLEGLACILYLKGEEEGAVATYRRAETFKNAPRHSRAQGG